MYFDSNVIVHIIVINDWLLQFEPNIHLLLNNPPFIFGRYTVKNAVISYYTDRINTSWAAHEAVIYCLGS